MSVGRSVGRSVGLSVCLSATNEFKKQFVARIVLLCLYEMHIECRVPCTCALSRRYDRSNIGIFSCDSSSIGRNFGCSVCLPLSSFRSTLQLEVSVCRNSNISKK